MADVGFTTLLVALGNNGTNNVVYVEDPATAGVMSAVSGATLAKEVTTAVIPGFQKVFFADGSVFKYLDFSSTWPSWNTWTSVSGSMPGDANIGCLYRGRIVLAGDSADPQMWYMSRQGTYNHWTYGSNDAQSAVAGGNAEAAGSPEIITALIPYADDYMVMGGAHKVHIMRGDPCAGGVIDLVLSSDGIFGPDAWCLDSEGNLYFAGTAGVYRMDRGGTIPRPLNTTRIPNLMDGIDRDTHRIVMGYDAQRQGIVIAFTKISDGTGTHYWYDLRSDGFFPETYIAGMGPYSLLFYDSDDEAFRGLLLGSSDGYIRRFDDTKKSDQGAAETAISSKVLLGPLDISAGDRQGRIKDLAVTLGSDTDAVSYDIFVNKSAEELLDDVTSSAAALHSGSFSTDGRQYNIRSKARGAALAVKLTNTTISSTFALEKLITNIEEAGRLKKL